METLKISIGAGVLLLLAVIGVITTKKKGDE